ncbi:MAG: Hypothetical protein BHV28_05810 [Candidatus Tokpelaia hoelldobleri]|uniref:DUF4357 domain-containing protein n=1 Tax=Candidatus Tokpelaia hoelldobleri TaxID=1902579 RepID=A0A1U9JTV1_9HYPH|nr:MAG: Hypothetical protein BHV28_05810 [Candidatus Tokpelaia hoelldoblerii]
MSSDIENFGKIIQLFLVNGSPNGLMIATLHGWTGKVIVCHNATFPQMLQRGEIGQAGIYFLYANEDPENDLKSKIYIGEAEDLKQRLPQSVANHSFWEKAVAVTTSDQSLTKGHVRYLEARLIELVSNAGRCSLANTQQPPAENRYLPEADRANMEAFLATLKIILPVIGLDVLKPMVKIIIDEAKSVTATNGISSVPHFEIRHRSGIKAKAQEIDGDFVVLKDSEALFDTGNVGMGYRDLRNRLIEQGILQSNVQKDKYIFTADYIFKSPSAAAAVVLERNANGRIEWKIEGKPLTYQQWQEQQIKL